MNKMWLFSVMEMLFMPSLNTARMQVVRCMLVTLKMFLGSLCASDVHTMVGNLTSKLGNVVILNQEEICRPLFIQSELIQKAGKWQLDLISLIHFISLVPVFDSPSHFFINMHKF
ncbi:uncharacterized protein [Penaeus vannamei]|uniref:uncharacterized protein isoform X2 n=1 Tax=Penaeus vannamei TaxID=6689 RepID=UPI00387F6A75